MLLAAGNLGRPFGGPAFTGLLDTYPSTEPAGSLRRLRGAYSGPCLRLRRASDSAETDIGWSTDAVDQDAIAAWCGASDGFISILYDQNTTYDFVPDTTVKQPKIYDGPSGLVLKNEHGNPAWYVAATSEFTMSGYPYSSALSVLISTQKDLGDDAGVLLWRGVNTSFSGVYQDNSTGGLSQNAGAPSFYLNGVLLSPQNRNALHDGLDTGVLETNVVGIRSTTMIGWIDKKVFGYEAGTYYSPVLRCADMIFWKDIDIALADFNAAALELKALLEA